MAKQEAHKERAWYAIHTYSGYENAVARNLKQRTDSLGMGDRIFDVVVPTEKKIKIKGGKRVEEEEKIVTGSPMKVALLGGAGYFSRSIIAGYIKSLSEDIEFIIADYDYRTARKMARKLGERFTSKMVDISDEMSFDKATEEADVVDWARVEAITGDLSILEPTSADDPASECDSSIDAKRAINVA